MKKRLTVIAATVVSAAALTGGLLMPAQGDFDLNGLNTQVQNHEARINNAEKNIQQLQNSTGTAPAPDLVDVPSSTPPPTTQTTTTVQPAPAPTTQAAQPAPAPAPSQNTGFTCSNTGKVVTDPNDCTPNSSVTVSN